MLNKSRIIFHSLSPATQSLLFPSDNIQGSSEAVHMVTARFQHLARPKLKMFQYFSKRQSNLNEDGWI
jgi:hypothetical protein